MKINWQTVLEFVIAMCIANVLTEFIVAPAAEWVYGKVAPAFEAMTK